MNPAGSGVGAESAASRRRIHSRNIEIEAFERSDGQFDLEARLTDVKDRDFPLASGVRAAGEPVHHMTLCLTIDRQLNVVAAAARSDAVPYPGACDTIGPAYARLVGLNLLDQFRRRVMEIMGGTKGCTHISELAGVLPTAAVQAFAGQVKPDPDAKPFQLDRCHALETSTENVRKYYPRWYRSSGDMAA